MKIRTAKSTRETIMPVVSFFMFFQSTSYTANPTTTIRSPMPPEP